MFQGSLTVLASFDFATSCPKIKFGACAVTGYCSFKGIQDSLGFRIPGSESEFFVSGTWLPDSSRWWDTGFLELHLDSKAQDSSFQKQKFPEFRVKIPLLHGGR